MFHMQQQQYLHECFFWDFEEALLGLFWRASIQDEDTS